MNAVLRVSRDFLLLKLHKIKTETNPYFFRLRVVGVKTLFRPNSSLKKIFNAQKASRI